MKIFKIAWPRNRWDILSERIAEEISRYIKENYHAFQDNTQSVRDIVSNGMPLKLHIFMLNENKNWAVTANGSTNPDTLRPNIYVKLNKYYFSDKYLSILWRRTSKAVRHEIDHIDYLTKLRENNKPFVSGYDQKKLLNPANISEGFEERIKYLSQDYEKTAFIRSLKGDAVRNKLSLIASIKEFIHDQLFLNNVVDENEIKKDVGDTYTIQIEYFLINQYIEAALTIYPRLLDSKFISDSDKGVGYVSAHTRRS